MKEIFISKQKLELTRGYRIAIAILSILLLTMISGFPQNFLLKVLFSLAFGFWIIYGIDLIILKNLGLSDNVENLKIIDVSVMKVDDSSYLRKIPGIKIITSSVPGDKLMYGVCFKVSEGTYKLIANISPSDTEKETVISSDVLLESFSGLKKEVVTTPRGEIILSFMPVSTKIELFQIFRSDVIPVDIKVKYPYIKY